jgi:hypothetical protein
MYSASCKYLTKGVSRRSLVLFNRSCRENLPVLESILKKIETKEMPQISRFKILTRVPS